MMRAMTIHDWTRVDAGTWHDFHQVWAGAIRQSLNLGLLPAGFYAQVERHAGRFEADVLALEEADADTAENAAGDSAGGGTALLTAPTMSKRLLADSAPAYAARANRVAVRRADGDRLVALIEIASPGNKDRASAVEAFARKAGAVFASGVHVSIVDLFPPTRHDLPGGLVGAAGHECGFERLELPADKRLCLGAAEADLDSSLYAEPLAVGDALPDLPVCLAPGRWVPVPLAATYAEAYSGTPAKYRRVLEAA